MSKSKNKEQSPNEQDINTDKTFVSGEAYPNCEGEACANVADETANETASVSDATGQVAAAATEIASLNSQLADSKDKYLRLQAEFDNYRKRTLREKMDLIESGGEDVIKSLLTVIDDLDRALAAIKSTNDLEALKSGVELIDTKLKDVLHSKGVEEIEALGKALDTDVHEAVAKIPAPKGADKGKIIDVVQKGYKLKDKVVRYAKVVVGE